MTSGWRWLKRATALGDERRDGGGKAGEPQPATSQAGDLAQFLLRLIQTGEHRLGVDHEGTAGVGEADGTHAPLDQPGPGLALEGGDLLADRRLGERQRLGRGRERAAGGDLPQHLETTRVQHKRSLTGYRDRDLTL